MKEITFCCLYCDHKWKKSYYYKPDIDDIKCEKCGDRQVRILKPMKNDDSFLKERK